MKRGTPDHPKMIMLTNELEKIYAAHHKKSAFGGRYQAVGILETLWEWCSRYAIQGDIGKWPDEVISSAIGWTFSGSELISALIFSKWLDTAPEPHRLVIHDIKDHATNAWRQNLEDAGLTWWDGSSPRKYKLQKNSRETPENSVNSPQPKPEPYPKPEPIKETKENSPPGYAFDEQYSGFREEFSVWAAHIVEADFKGDAWREWRLLDHLQRIQATNGIIERRCRGDDPAFAPAPAKYLKGRESEWNRPARPKPKSALDRKLEGI